jgi:hypothetical protein
MNTAPESTGKHRALVTTVKHYAVTAAPILLLVIQAAGTRHP